jgi:hypothetical protein
MEQQLVAGLDEGLSSWSASPSAFSTARNGGAESAIRAHLLGFLERSTSCVAFTESAGERADVVLRARRESNCTEEVMLELKHNFLHRRQIPFIRASYSDAPQQLRDAWPAIAATALCFYVHFVLELRSDPEVTTHMWAPPIRDF